MRQQEAPRSDSETLFQHVESQLQFTNHASAHKHVDFVTAEVEKCVKAGGYWQVSMHESMHMYLGVEWNGSDCVWAYLPFGLAPGPGKQEVYRPLREMKVRIYVLPNPRPGRRGNM